MKKYSVGTTKGQLVFIWICLSLTIVFVGSMCGVMAEDFILGLFITVFFLLPLIAFCVWAIVYTQMNYNRTAYALSGNKKMAKIVKIRKIGGRAPYTEITFIYRTDKGEDVLGIESVPYGWYKIVSEDMMIHIYVNGEYGCFKKDEFEYDVTHQDDFNYYI